MKPFQFFKRLLYKGLVSFLVAPVSGAASVQPRRDLDTLLQPGDVILVAGKTRFASLVCRMTRSTWSHVAIYVGNGHHSDPARCVVEADVEAGVRMIRLADLADHDILVVRASHLQEASRDELIAHLLDRVGHRYDLDHVIALARLLLIAPLPLARWIRTESVRRADPTRAICSTLVAHALFTAGVSVGASPLLSARLPAVGKAQQADQMAGLDYLVPGDFERLPEFVPVFNSRLPA
ncbi:MAG: YiiX/YebB-like N1pC/P60 family cysteine hydrolase [Lautropia sp.]